MGCRVISKKWVALGEHLTSRRKLMSLRQHHMAKRLKLSQGSIVNIEAGRTRITAERLFEVARAYGTSEYTLLEFLR